MVSIKEHVSTSAEAWLCVHQGRLVWIRKLHGRDDRSGHCNDVRICVPICQLHGRVYGFQGIDNRLCALPQFEGCQIFQVVGDQITPREWPNDLERSDHHASFTEI